MKRKILLTLLIFCNLTFFYAQQAKSKQKSDFWKHVQLGGGLTLDFGNRTTNLGIAPSVLYNFNEKISAGIGISYLYSKHRDYASAVNSYGGSIISLYNPVKGLQISGEYEHTYLTNGSASRDVPALFFGVGYTAVKNMAVGLRYDVLYNDKSLYSSALTPFVRVYF